MKLNKLQRETLNILATEPGVSEHWTMDAAVFKTQTSEEFLRAFLATLDTEIEGVAVWWDEVIENSGEYDFGIAICDAHFGTPHPKNKSVCTCDNSIQ